MVDIVLSNNVMCCDMDITRIMLDPYEALTKFITNTLLLVSLFTLSFN